MHKVKRHTSSHLTNIEENVRSSKNSLTKVNTTLINGFNSLSAGSNNDYSAFGDLIVCNLQPLIQINNTYNYINPRQIETFTAGTGATVGSSDGRFVITNGADLYGYSTMRGLQQLKYRPGQGLLVRFTTIFDQTNAVANSLQLAGVGVSGNHLAFGYNGTSFGVTKKTGGAGHVHRLEVTTAEGSSTTAVVTLNSVATNVTLTNAGGSKEFTAHQIAETAFAGWTTESIGVYVYFNRSATGTAGGTYTYANGGGSSASTMTQRNAGVADTDLWIAQSSWNGDVMDGTGASGMTLDTSKGNVYQIRYQWLGYGQMSFYIESSDTGEFVLVHAIKYTNTSTSTSLRKPSMRPLFACASLGSTTSITMYVGSFAGFNEGIVELEHLPHWAVSNEKDISSNTETVILDIRNKLLFNDIINTSELIVYHFSLASDGTKSVTVRIYLNSIIGAGTTGDYPNYTEEDASSIAVYDTTAATNTNGFLIDSFILQKVGNGESTHRFYLERNESLTITAESAGASTITCSINWKEDL